MSASGAWLGGWRDRPQSVNAPRPNARPSRSRRRAARRASTAGSAAVAITCLMTAGRFVLAAVGHFEHQFVMDLQQHPHAARGRRRPARVHPRHRALDDVGAGALDRRVDRGALGALRARAGSWRADVAGSASSGRTGRGEAAARARSSSVSCDVGADAGEALEIAVDHRLRLVRGHAEPAGQAPARDAVEDREVDRLGLAARVAVDLAEQLLRGQAVDVVAVRERVLQLRHVGHVRGEPQLDLAVVGARG